MGEGRRPQILTVVSHLGQSAPQCGLVRRGDPRTLTGLALALAALTMVVGC